MYTRLVRQYCVFVYDFLQVDIFPQLILYCYIMNTLTLAHEAYSDLDVVQGHFVTWWMRCALAGHSRKDSSL